MTKHDMFLFLARNLSLGFQIFESNHGWHDDSIKIRTRNSDFLIDKDGHLSCMCIFDKKNLIDERVTTDNLVSRLEELRSNHRCTPWPG